MLQQQNTKPLASKTAFEELASGEELSLLGEFRLFIVENKAWWMVPILLVFAALGLLIVLSLTGAAPLLYAF